MALSSTLSSIHRSAYTRMMPQARRAWNGLRWVSEACESWSSFLEGGHRPAAACVATIHIRKASIDGSFFPSLFLSWVLDGRVGPANVISMLENSIYLYIATNI